MMRAKGKAWGRRVVCGCLAAGVLAASGCGRRPSAPAPLQFAPGDEVQYVPVAEPVFALTYDDGPNRPYTDQVLDLLKAEGATATFFLVGANVERHPEVVQRILAEGHEIGNHTFTHTRLELISRDEVIREVDEAERAIMAAAGVRSKYFRTSFGSVPEGIADLSRERGYLMVGWSVDGNDWNSQDARAIAELVLRRLHAGAIVLLHDGRGTHDGYDQARCVEATRLILAGCKARGLRAVSMSELIRHYRPAREEVQIPGGPRYLGARVTPSTIEAGTMFEADYYWYFSADCVREPLGVAVHYVGPDGKRFQDDHTLRVAHMKAFEDQVRVPADAPPGEYRLHLALCGSKDPTWKGRVPLETQLPTRNRMAATPTVLAVTAPRPGSGRGP